MFAAVLTAIASFKMIVAGENHQTIFIIVKILGLKWFRDGHFLECI